MSLNILDNNQRDAIALRQDRKAKFVLFRELAPEGHKEWLVPAAPARRKACWGRAKPSSVRSAWLWQIRLGRGHGASRLALGWPWHGRGVKCGAVLYVALERRQIVIRRAIAFREHYQVPDAPFAIVGGVYDLRTSQAVNELITVVKQIEEETAEELVLIVIDTISRALCGGDENSSKDMGAIVAATSRLQTATKAHVLWVHHMPQDGQRGLGATVHCSGLWTPPFTWRSCRTTFVAPRWSRPTTPRRATSNLFLGECHYWARNDRTDHSAS